MNAKAEPSHQHRHGLVQFPLVELLSDPAKFAPIISRLAIVGVRVDASENLAQYKVWHPSLRSIGPEEVTPKYTVILWQGKVIFSPADAPSRPTPSTTRQAAAASL